MKIYIARRGQTATNSLKYHAVAHSGVSKAFSGYFEGIQDGKFLNRGLENCEIKEYEL